MPTGFLVSAKHLHIVDILPQKRDLSTVKAEKQAKIVTKIWIQQGQNPVDFIDKANDFCYAEKKLTGVVYGKTACVFGLEFTLLPEG